MFLTYFQIYNTVNGHEMAMVISRCKRTLGYILKPGQPTGNDFSGSIEKDGAFYKNNHVVVLFLRILRLFSENQGSQKGYGE